MLAKTGSKQPSAIVNLVRAQVIEAVLRVDNDVPASDKQMFGRTVEFAVWMHRTKGSFDLTRDLTDDAIDAYVADPGRHKGRGTPGTVASALRRVMHGGSVKATGAKRPTVEAYPDDQWQAFWEAASDIGERTLDAQILLTLTGELGLFPEEVRNARSDWVGHVHGRHVLRVPNEHGEFRELPLDPRSARILTWAKKERPGEYLLMPTRKSGRKNTISLLAGKLEVGHRAFGEFSTARARNYWLARLLTKPIPFHYVMYLANNKTSVTPVQLAARLPRPDDEDVHRAMRKAGCLR